MSGMALIWAANVKGLKPAAKIVLIQLADFHNKETGQCNPSAQRLADECEMGRATLFRHMTTLEECGFITRHARGDGDGGRGSNQYELHLDITLGPSARPKGGGSGQNGVVSQNETGGNVSKKRGKSLKVGTGVVSNRDRNLTIEPVREPPSRRREAVEAEKVLEAYPPDRLRGKAACLAQIEEAVKEGIAPEALLQAVQAYATESAGFTRSRVCFSDNWFQTRRWQGYIEDRLRRTVDAGLESLSGSIGRLRGTMDARDEGRAGWVEALRDRVGQVTSLIDRCLGRLDAGRSDLRAAIVEAQEQLGDSQESRDAPRHGITEDMDAGERHGLRH